FAADHRRRNAALFQIGQDVNINEQPVRQYDQRLYPAIEQHFQVSLEAAAFVVNIGQDWQVRSLVKTVFDSSQHQRAVRVGHVEHHDTDGMTAFAAQGTCEQVGTIPQCLGGALNALLGC